MNFLNRLLGILAAIFIGVIVFLFLVYPQVVNQIVAITGDMGRTADQPYELGQALLHWFIALVIDGALAWFFVILPIRSIFYHRRAGDGLVVQKGQGIAYMDRESVRQQVYAGVTKIKDIERVEVSIDNDQGRAVVLMNILTKNTISGPQKKQEIRRELHKVIEDQLGIRIAGDPTINISLTPISGDVPHAVPGMSPESGKSALPPLSPRAVPPPPVYTPPVRQEPPRPVSRIESEVVAPPAPKPTPVVVPAEPVTEPEKEPEVPEKSEASSEMASSASPLFTRRAFVPTPKSTAPEEVVTPAAPEVVEESNPAEQPPPLDSKPLDTQIEPVESAPSPEVETKADDSAPTEPPMTE